jgi:hypothetical protein
MILKNRDKRYVCKRIVGKTLQEAFIIVKGSFMKMQVSKMDGETMSTIKPCKNTVTVFVSNGIVKKSIIHVTGEDE